MCLGLGVFATRDILKDQIIALYKGEIQTEMEDTTNLEICSVLTNKTYSFQYDQLSAVDS